MKHWHLQLASNLLLATGLTAAFGGALQSYFPDISPWAMAGHALAATGIGWIILMLLARINQQLWAPYWLGLGKIMSIGVLILLPSIFLLPQEINSIWLPLVNVAISFMTMLMLNIRLNKKLQNGTQWNLYWVLCLGVAASSWILIHADLWMAGL